MRDSWPKVGVPGCHECRIIVSCAVLCGKNKKATRLLPDAVWKGPYDLKKTGDVDKIQRMVTRVDQFTKWGIPTPAMDLFGEADHDRHVWLRFPQLASVPAAKWSTVTKIVKPKKSRAKDPEKRAKADAEKKTHTFVVVVRASMGTEILSRARKADWARAEIVIPAILALAGRCLVEPPCGDSHLGNLLLVRADGTHHSKTDQVVSVDLEENRSSMPENEEQVTWHQWLFSKGKQPSAEILRAMEEGMRKHDKALYASIQKLRAAMGQATLDLPRTKHVLAALEGVIACDAV